MKKKKLIDIVKKTLQEALKRKPEELTVEELQETLTKLREAEEIAKDMKQDLLSTIAKTQISIYQYYLYKKMLKERRIYELAENVYAYFP